MMRIRKLAHRFLSSGIGGSNQAVYRLRSSSIKRRIFQRSPSEKSCYWDNMSSCRRTFCTAAGTILVQAHDPAKISLDIQNAADERRYDDAWRSFQQHLHMEGFPRKSVVKKLLTSFAESLDSRLLELAFGLVELGFEQGKQTLFEKETLLYLSLALARCGLPVSASILLRKLVGMEEYPPVKAWSAVLAHMSESSSGAYLSAELILEFGYLFQNNRVDPRKKSNAPLIAMKPNTLAFNVALAGCLLFETTKIAEQLLDMMPRIGVKADVTSLLMMAQIYERNGRIQELKKLGRHIDDSHNLSELQFRQYYDCLLTCHLKFGDLDSVSQMVLDMLRKAKEAQNSIAAATLRFGQATGENLLPSSGNSNEFQEKSSEENETSYFLSFEEFCKDQTFTHLEAKAKEILSCLTQKLQNDIELVASVRGILKPTEKTYVKLAKAFLETGKIKQLAEFLIKAEKEDCLASDDESAFVHIINSCITLGWLDQAHDLIDELNFAGIRISASLYSSLLKSYCKANRMQEVTALLREVKRAGIQLDASCYDTLLKSRVLEKDTQGALNLFKDMKEAKIVQADRGESDVLGRSPGGGGDTGFMAKLLHEIKEGQRVDSGVHDWNDVIHFFCKKRLMQDAEKALKKMRSLGLTPNAQTFHSMVTGYAAIGGKYIEVAELWGEMKSIAAATPLKFDQELLDSVLYTFVRGGFFVRANEVVEMMEKKNMFIDKYKYRTLFLKYHRTLYKGKAQKVHSESQLKKRDAALAFKKWIGLT